MRPGKTVEKILLCMAILGCLYLAGCIEPVPHTSIRAAQISGRVVDGITRQPLPGVQIILEDDEALSTKTDAGGNFVLHGKKNFHIAKMIGVCAELDLPEGKHYLPIIEVTNAGYLVAYVNAGQHAARDNTTNDPAHLKLRDIPLMPIVK